MHVKKTCCNIEHGNSNFRIPERGEHANLRSYVFILSGQLSEQSEHWGWTSTSYHHPSPWPGVLLRT